MVFIPEQPIITRNAAGQRCAFNFRRFNDDLHAAFMRNGVKDRWIEEQLSLSLEEKLRDETQRSTPLSEEEIDSLLISVLMASGYADVASDYAELHGANPLRRFLAELSPWDDARLMHAITKGLPVTSAQASALLPACRSALEQLHLQHVSDSFIVELAIQLAHEGNTRARQEYREPSSEEDTGADVKSTPAPSTVPGRSESSTASPAMPAVIAHNKDPFIRLLTETGILHAYPIAPIFPHAQVALSLQNFCTHFTDGWPSELTIAQAFKRPARAILHILQEIRMEIAQNFPRLADSTAYITLTDYGDFIEHYSDNVSKTERAHFDLAVRDILAAYLVKQAAFTVKLSYR